MPKVSSQSELWKVLDSFRADSAFKSNEIAPKLAALIYLRWADFQEAEQEAIAAFDDTDYEPALPASMHWRTWHSFPTDRLQFFFRDELPARLDDLRNNRHNSLATHLHRMAYSVFQLGKLSSSSLVGLIDWLADQPFETPADRLKLLRLFDDLLNQSIKGNQGGVRESLDPKWISQLVVALGAPKPGERIYDPCFGSAGYLTASCEQIATNNNQSFTRSGSPQLSISGVELNADAFVIGLTRLALAGIEDPKLELGNSLERIASNNPHKEGFDLVLANPPWGMRVNTNGLDHFPIKTNDATGLFVQHALSQLRPDGRAVIVVPQSFLFRAGQEQKLRRVLLEQHTVEAVIALPANAFAPFTSVRSSILLLRRNGPTETVRMIDAETFFDKGLGKEPAIVRKDMANELARRVRSPQLARNCWDVSVDEIEEADWDLTPRHRDQSGLEGLLDSLRVETPIVQLNECCQILSGRQIKSSELAEYPGGEAAIPYIRIKDIQRGQTRKGSSWLREDVAQVIDPKWKLRAGDVLVSKSGTIGKTGVVRNGAIGAIATSGLFILRPDQGRIDPHYLMAYFASSECRIWLESKTRGAVINNLSKKVVDELLVPLPPLQIQQRVAESHIEHKTDALTYLSQLLLEKEDDPIVLWLDDSLDYFKEESSSKSHDIAPLISILGAAFSKKRNLTNERIAENRLADWVISMDKAARILYGTFGVPPGAAYYSILQQADVAFGDVSRTIKGHLPVENRARELTKLFSERIQAAKAWLIDSTKVTISSEALALISGEQASIEVVLTNEGDLPIRNFTFKTTPDWGGEQIDFLAEKTEKTMEISGQVPQGGSSFSIFFELQYIAMDGREVEGVCELPFELITRHNVEKEVAPDMGSSPYVCGAPITPKRSDVFFGRAELLEGIRRQVRLAGNVVLLEGNRRAGKTSILSHLSGKNSVEGWLGVYSSLQGAAGSEVGVGVPTDEVFRSIARAIAKAIHDLGLNTPLPNGETLPADKRPLAIPKACREGISAEPFVEFESYIVVILELLEEQGLGLLLMLDEFDKLQEGIENGVTSPQVPENIRYLVQQYPRFSAILTGSRRLKRLREEYWSALYGLGTRIGVTSLKDSAAESLITEPVKDRLTYSRESINRAIHLTAGQPFLLQCLCNRVFDMAAELKIRSITLHIVDRSGMALIEDNEHFASLWDYAGSDRRRFLLALCHKESAGPDPLRLGVIQERLLNAGIEASDDDIIADLEYLQELELIELAGESTGKFYRLAIPLMGIWIDKQRDMDAVLSRAKTESEGLHE
jgi:type I restriction enzyme M protein